jgi:hypothetical protein
VFGSCKRDNRMVLKDFYCAASLSSVGGPTTVWESCRTHANSSLIIAEIGSEGEITRRTKTSLLHVKQGQDRLNERLRNRVRIVKAKLQWSERRKREREWERVMGTVSTKKREGQTVKGTEIPMGKRRQKSERGRLFMCGGQRAPFNCGRDKGKCGHFERTRERERESGRSLWETDKTSEQQRSFVHKLNAN